MDQAEQDVLAFMIFPKDHRTKIHSTNPQVRIPMKTATDSGGDRRLLAAPTPRLGTQSDQGFFEPIVANDFPTPVKPEDETC
jgi:hypothetical protein